MYFFVKMFLAIICSYLEFDFALEETFWISWGILEKRRNLQKYIFVSAINDSTATQIKSAKHKLRRLEGTNHNLLIKS